LSSESIERDSILSASAASDTVRSKVQKTRCVCTSDVASKRREWRASRMKWASDGSQMHRNELRRLHASPLELTIRARHIHRFVNEYVSLLNFLFRGALRYARAFQPARGSNCRARLRIATCSRYKNAFLKSFR